MDNFSFLWQCERQCKKKRWICRQMNVWHLTRVHIHPAATLLYHSHKGIINTGRGQSFYMSSYLAPMPFPLLSYNIGYIPTFFSCLLVFLLSAQSLPTLIKKEIKFSSYIMKFRMEQLQSHIWLTASSYKVKYLRISSCIRKYMTLQLLHSEFLHTSIWGKFYCLFHQCILASFNIILLLRSTQSTLITYRQQYVVHIKA